MYAPLTILIHLKTNALPEKCQIRKFLWSVFSRIWTEYGEIPSISPYSASIGTIDSKKLALDADPKATQLVSFTKNLVQDGKTTLFLILKEVKEIVLDFHKKLIIKVL